MPGYREIGRLGQGKSFGELALINEKPRMATAKCLTDTHFAILESVDYKRSLMKFEKIRFNNLMMFLKNIPCFNKWSRNQFIKFSFYMKKVSYIRN